ncbi:hypothetical protein GCM10023144_41010 [Pigmentiphaga soli]|uniref:Uncharacterized protein n=1 Tax=Pigmentiphaga soli TaxID=1007095 RepID=A0ABP8HL46_9BURK
MSTLRALRQRVGSVVPMTDVMVVVGTSALFLGMVALFSDHVAQWVLMGL